MEDGTTIAIGSSVKINSLIKLEKQRLQVARGCMRIIAVRFLGLMVENIVRKGKKIFLTSVIMGAIEGENKKQIRSC